MPRLLLSLALLAASALAAPLVAPAPGAAPAAVDVVVEAAPELAARAVTTLSTATLAGYAPYTQLARAAYCPPAKVTGWACGGTFLS